MEGSFVLSFPRFLRLMATTTYDLLKDGYEPLFIDGNLFFVDGLRGEFRGRYDLGLGSFDSFDFRIKKDGDGSDFEFGVRYLRPQELDLNGGFMIWIGPKTRMKLGMCFDTRKDKIDELEVSIYRDLHCWELEIGARTYPSFRPIRAIEVETYLHLNLKEF